MFLQQFDPMEMDFILRYYVNFMRWKVTVSVDPDASLDLLNVFRQRTEVEQYNMFFIYWSLKESYIKAIGLGLGFDLKEVIFRSALLLQSSLALLF